MTRGQRYVYVIVCPDGLLRAEAGGFVRARTGTSPEGLRGNLAALDMPPPGHDNNQRCACGQRGHRVRRVNFEASERRTP